MSLSARHPSTLIRPPAERHLRMMEQHRSRLEATIRFCSEQELRTMLVVEENSTGNRLSRASYLPTQRCKLTSIMALGPEEHEAIEILNTILDYDLVTEIPILIHDPNVLDRTFSFFVLKSKSPATQH